VLVMIVFGATLMKDAPKQEVKTSNGVVEKDYTLAESMRKPQYWMLAVMFLTACMSGLYVIGVAKDIAQSLAHLDAISAANAVTVISIANLSGRLVLGILSDKIARIRVITIGQVIALVGMAAAVRPSGVWVWRVLGWWWAGCAGWWVGLGELDFCGLLGVVQQDWVVRWGLWRGAREAFAAVSRVRDRESSA
ncbi:hypothetical protein, partial [Pseudomonas aeruginosa]|uniref:hypothetical protein n=1 Tax=Pseudomonas aeruginosa TaxID=287 RepID=UPI001C9835A8